MRFINNNYEQIDFTIMKLVEALLLKIQGYRCALCKRYMVNYQIHHKKYGENITLYDLELLHRKCHLTGKHNLK